MRPIIDEDIYYFEIKIIKAPDGAYGTPKKNSYLYIIHITDQQHICSIIGIGFCEDNAPLNQMLGWDAGSWGYHGVDGAIFDAGKRPPRAGTPFGDVYTADDVIGCGENFNKHIAFYTKNGTVIGTFSASTIALPKGMTPAVTHYPYFPTSSKPPTRPFTNQVQTIENPIGRAFKHIRGKLYPAVSFASNEEGCQIAAVFRDGRSSDFLFQGPYDGPDTLEPPKGLETPEDDSDPDSESGSGSGSGSGWESDPCDY